MRMNLRAVHPSRISTAKDVFAESPEFGLEKSF